MAIFEKHNSKFKRKIDVTPVERDPTVYGYFTKTLDEDFMVIDILDSSYKVDNLIKGRRSANIIDLREIDHKNDELCLIYSLFDIMSKYKDGSLVKKVDQIVLNEYKYIISNQGKTQEIPSFHKDPYITRVAVAW